MSSNEYFAEQLRALSIDLALKSDAWALDDEDVSAALQSASLSLAEAAQDVERYNEAMAPLPRRGET